MANNVSDKQFNALVAEVKKNPGNSERHYAEKTGIPMGAIGRALYDAEVEADPKLKIAQTGAAITAAVKKGTLRWPRIAAYAGITVGAAKKLYETHTGETAPSNITGRGRKTFNGNGAAPAATGTGNRRTGVQPIASGRRRGAAAGKAGTAAGKPAGKPAGRRGTRAATSPK